MLSGRDTPHLCPHAPDSCPPLKRWIRRQAAGKPLIYICIYIRIYIYTLTSARHIYIHPHRQAANIYICLPDMCIYIHIYQAYIYTPSPLPPCPANTYRYAPPLCFIQVRMKDACVYIRLPVYLCVCIYTECMYIHRVYVYTQYRCCV
jgi:hypothetical protein